MKPGRDMHTKIDEKTENKSKAIASSVVQRESNRKQGVVIVDNRSHNQSVLQAKTKLNKVGGRKKNTGTNSTMQRRHEETTSSDIDTRLLCLINDLQSVTDNDYVQNNSELSIEGRKNIRAMLDVFNNGEPVAKHHLVEGIEKFSTTIQTDEVGSKYKHIEKNENVHAPPKQLVSSIAVSIGIVAIGALIASVLAYRNKLKLEEKRQQELKENADWFNSLIMKYPDRKAVLDSMSRLGASSKHDGTSCSMNSQIIASERQGLTPEKALEVELELVKKKSSDTQDKMVQRIASLLRGYEMLYVQLTPDHHFTILPLPDNKAAILQGWQGRYTLSECLQSGETIKPIDEIIENLHGLSKKESIASSAMNLFGVTEQSKVQIEKDYGKESSYCTINNVMVVPKNKSK